MAKLTIGPEVIQAVCTAYAAHLAVWLDGGPGIGKSEIVEQAALKLGIGYFALNLAPMERTDWEGLPDKRNGKSVFLRPAFLPDDGVGLFVLEEMNRAGDDVLAPLHEFLTRRCINEHSMPPGWLPVAITNPEGSEYLLPKLGDALRSRFTHLPVRASVDSWMEYAKSVGVHPDVIRYALFDRTIFDDDALSNPRSWTSVSDLLYAAEKRNVPKKILRAMVEGQVTAPRAAAFFRFLRGDNATPLEALDVLTQYPKHQGNVRTWVKGRIDLVDRTLSNLRMHLQLEHNFAALQRSEKKKKNLQDFLKDIPGDLGQQMAEWFVKKGYVIP